MCAHPNDITGVRSCHGHLACELGKEGRRGREEGREDIKLKQKTEDRASVIILVLAYFILISSWTSRDTN